MHFLCFLLAALPLALGLTTQSPFEHPCSGADHTYNHKTSSCLQKPYCPGREASESLQRHLFTQFTETLYVEKNITKAFEVYVSPNVIEHDPEDAQDRDDIVARLSHIIPFANFTILRSSFGDNVGLVLLKVEQNPEPLALADIYRMDGTCIVEHWDITQARPANSTNPIAMF